MKNSWIIPCHPSQLCDNGPFVINAEDQISSFRLIVEIIFTILVEILIVDPGLEGISECRILGGENKEVFFPLGAPKGFKGEGIVLVLQEPECVELFFQDDFSLCAHFVKGELDIRGYLAELPEGHIDPCQVVLVGRECLPHACGIKNMGRKFRHGVGVDIEIESIVFFEADQKKLHQNKEKDKKKFDLFKAQFEKFHVSTVLKSLFCSGSQQDSRTSLFF